MKTGFASFWPGFSAGYRVLEANNARNGLRVLEQEEIHLVISDVKLPDISDWIYTTGFRCFALNCPPSATGATTFRP
ncbi:hypothetical protein [Larkinella arboricola]